MKRNQVEAFKKEMERWRQVYDSNPSDMILATQARHMMLGMWAACRALGLASLDEWCKEIAG